MYRTLLVPLDGSPFAEDALPMGRRLARTLGAEVHLAHVIQPAPDVVFKTPEQDLDWNRKARDWADAYLMERAGEGSSEGVSSFTAVLEGPISVALEEYATEQGVDLIVMTTHGEGGIRRWWLGSVADRLLRSPSRDILLVRPWDDTAERPPGVSRFERILVPLDGSSLAESALATARELRDRFGAVVRAVTIVPKPVELSAIRGLPGVELRSEGHDRRVSAAAAYLDEVAGRGIVPDLAGIVIESGGAAEGVIDAAQAWGADLILLSSHGRMGFSRAVLGSVADKIIRGATQPILVVRREEA